MPNHRCQTTGQAVVVLAVSILICTTCSTRREEVVVILALIQATRVTTVSRAYIRHPDATTFVTRICVLLIY